MRSKCRKGKLNCVESPEAFVLCFFEPEGRRKCFMVSYITDEESVKQRRSPLKPPSPLLSIIELPDQDADVLSEYCDRELRKELEEMLRKNLVRPEELDYIKILEEFEKQTRQTAYKPSFSKLT